MHFACHTLIGLLFQNFAGRWPKFLCLATGEAPDLRTASKLRCGGFVCVESLRCRGARAEGDQVSITPEELNLGPLQNNGGPTLTQPPGPGSAASDVVEPEDCMDAEGDLLTSDQRGIARPQGPRCDMGAVKAVP